MDAKLLGLRIRQARERLGMSQEELAARANKDQSAISEWENGRRKLAVTDLPAIATVLEAPLSYFLEEDAAIYELDDALLNYFHQLPDTAARQAVIDIVRVFHNTVQRYQP